MRRILVANRGEIALRAVRAARMLGIETVAVHSSADRGAPHVFAADRAVCIGPPPSSKSYLVADSLLHVAKVTGADAIYPGYGFLSERASFAEACAKAGVNFIGPSPEVIRLMGDKSEAKSTAARLGVPLVPGSDSAFETADEAARSAAEIGFPVLLKARAGGGGRGMRVVDAPEKLVSLVEQAMREADSAFGDGAIYVERFLSKVRHVEVQVFGDRHGATCHLGERDCTIQRRHQKLVEEGPSVVLPPAVREEMCAAAVRLAAGIGYVGAGTVEFVFDAASGKHYFIEMNTRIQVEHPVTEMLTGMDLVLEQLRVARGEHLSVGGCGVAPSGHAIEFRINAEDWRRDFQPSPGRLTRWRPPSGAGVRVDTFAYEGMVVQPYYDSLLGKLIVHGETRAEALAIARRALTGLDVAGLPTTRDFHLALLDDPDFVAGNVHTRWVETAFLPRHVAGGASGPPENPRAHASGG